MDSVTASIPPAPEVQFDTARITAEVDALADRHAGKDDQFRAAITQLLKGELARARDGVRGRFQTRFARHPELA